MVVVKGVLLHKLTFCSVEPFPGTPVHCLFPSLGTQDPLIGRETKDSQHRDHILKLNQGKAHKYNPVNETRW